MDVRPYERRLAAVMTKLGIREYRSDYGAKDAWVVFTYDGRSYRIDHGISNAASHGRKLRDGAEAFCQIVLTLEDLARASSHGVRDLQTWIEGISQFPWPTAR